MSTTNDLDGLAAREAQATPYDPRDPLDHSTTGCGYQGAYRLGQRWIVANGGRVYPSAREAVDAATRMHPRLAISQFRAHRWSPGSDVCPCRGTVEWCECGGVGLR